MRQKLISEVERMGNQTKNMAQEKEKKFVYVRRNKDGAVFDIPEKNLADTLKQGFTYEGTVDQFTEDISKLFEEELVVEPVKEVEFTNPLKCPSCEFVAKTSHGLKIHGKKH